MKYMGSKARIAKHILPVILNSRTPAQCYVEPFVGGANTITRVEGNRLGADVNRFLIAMFKGFQNDFPVVFDTSREHYNLVREAYNNKDNSSFTDFHIGCVGFMASANGRFFEGGYSGVSRTKIGTIRNYIDESIRSMEKYVHKLTGIDFIHSSYIDLPIPQESIVYCDIPYKDTKQYAFSKGFEHNVFWDWARDQVTKGNTIFVSEYVAPNDFVCVWEKEVKSSLSANGKSGKNKLSIERLFAHRSQV